MQTGHCGREALYFGIRFFYAHIADLDSRCDQNNSKPIVEIVIDRGLLNMVH